MKDMDMYEKAWAGKHGKEYTERCEVTALSRVQIFESILDKMGAVTSVLEVGCNKGHNLDAIALVHKGMTDCQGIEINKDLCDRSNITNASAYDIPWVDDLYDLVFTAGVLIHIPTPRLHDAMAEMRRVSKKYVLMIEYPADKEVGAKYEADFNWQEGVWWRPYGKEYTHLFPMDKLVAHGPIKDLGDDGWGFTECDYWIFEKS